MKRLIPLAFVLVASISAVRPAMASDSLVKIDFESVRLMPNGSLRIAFSYRCPGGLGYRPHKGGTLLLAEQFQPDDVWGQKTFDRYVACDGQLQTLVRRIHLPNGGTFRRDLPINVWLDLGVSSRSDSYPGSLGAGRRNTLFFDSGNQAIPRSYVRIGQTRVTSRGVLVVGVTYACPEGWQVVPGDVDWEDIVAYQTIRRSRQAYAFQTLLHDVVCDGVAHTIVKKMPSQFDQPFVQGIPVDIETNMILLGDCPGTCTATESRSILV